MRLRHSLLSCDEYRQKSAKDRLATRGRKDRESRGVEVEVDHRGEDGEGREATGNEGGIGESSKASDWREEIKGKETGTGTGSVEVWEPEERRRLVVYVQKQAGGLRLPAYAQMVTQVDADAHRFDASGEGRRRRQKGGKSGGRREEGRARGKARHGRKGGQEGDGRRRTSAHSPVQTDDERGRHDLYACVSFDSGGQKEDGRRTEYAPRLTSTPHLNPRMLGHDLGYHRHPRVVEDSRTLRAARCPPCARSKTFLTRCLKPEQKSKTRILGSLVEPRLSLSIKVRSTPITSPTDKLIANGEIRATLVSNEPRQLSPVHQNQKSFHAPQFLPPICDSGTLYSYQVDVCTLLPLFMILYLKLITQCLVALQRSRARLVLPGSLLWSITQISAF
ncbi:hypothetical protein C8R45DRAFT_934014 [Mycena sanguinolenta]|nr:hypothetical protein C8R45DRAFT_934014 [Mycena sanguinolenta]